MMTATSCPEWKRFQLSRLRVVLFLTSVLFTGIILCVHVVTFHQEHQQLYEVHDRFEKFIEIHDYDCGKNVRLGNIGDGGWNVCMDGKLAFVDCSCLVYSFGINWDFSFDDEVSSKYGCQVRSFDPSMNVGDHKRGKTINFYAIGLSGYNYNNNMTGWTMKTLTSIVNSLNDTGRVIDFLKFDIEYSEWSVLRSFLESAVAADLLRYRVKQLALEIHSFLGEKKPNVTEYEQQLRLLVRFESELGFRRWYSHANEWSFTMSWPSSHRKCCYEVAYVNTNYIS